MGIDAVKTGNAGFLSGGGELAGLIADFPWASTALGAIGHWPQSLKTTIDLILRSPVPIVTLWGEDGVMIYNDAYSIFAGARHPSLLGSKVREGWEEVSDFNDNIMKVVLAGGTLAYTDQELTLYRNGEPEQVWMNLDYSPTLDDDGNPNGVIAIVVETTEKVRAERRLIDERERLSTMFEQAPGFMAILQGADHRFTLVNAAYQQLIGHREVIGKTTAEALPDAVAQGYLELLDEVFRSGKAFTATGAKYAVQSEPGAPVRERFVDFVFQPIVDATGSVTGVFVEGADVTERSAAEELLRIAQEGGGVGTFEWFPSTGHLWGTSQYRKIWGLSAEAELTSDLLVSLVLPEDQSEVGPAKLGGDENPIAYAEYRIRRPDTGEIRWLARRGEVLGGEGGATARYVGVAFDITDQKRAESALREAELRLRLALDAAAIGVWEYDVATGRLTWDDRVRQVAEIAEGAEVDWTQDFLGVVHPDDASKVVEAFSGILQPDAADDLALDFRVVGRVTGRVTWSALEGRRIVDKDGNIRVIGTARDVTAEREASEKLRRLNETLEQRVSAAIAERQLWADMFEGSDDPVAAVDTEFRFLAFNRAYQNTCERLFGVRFEIGQRLDQALSHMPEARDASIATWKQALQGRGFEIRESAEAGDNPSFYDLQFRPLRDRRGVQIGAFQYSRDVTQRVLAKTRLQQTEDALRQAQKMEAVGQLTGGVAHDFNNMLAIIIGSLDLLGRRSPVTDPRARRYLDAAAEGARRAAVLTQRLLAFARQQPLKPEPLDPNKLVADMSDLLRHSLGEQIRLETVLAGGLWRAHADPNQLENVVLNLAVNARDAMPEGGRLTIETQNAHLDARYVSAHPGVPEGQYVMIAVSDSGAGMPAEVIAKAFDPFFTTKQVGKGTGLGLSQVYGFIKQSGGHVKIYSELNQGTTVKVYLPRLVGALSEVIEQQQATTPAHGDRDEVILVVEDERSVRQFSADALDELGYRVLEAEGGESALRLLDQHPEITLLFTDVVMPDVNGRKLADEALRRRPDLKVLFTTGYSRNAVVHNGVLDQGVELISKPFTVDELAAKVRQILDRTAPLVD